MGSRRLLLSILVFAVVGTVADDGYAEPTSDERATAFTLFKRGRELMEAGEVEPACRSFEESHHLDPGGGTLLNLAVCHEQLGRTASAWTEYSDALALARRDGRPDRGELARERMAALEPALARLVIERPEREPAGLRILRDGTDVPREAWGIGVPVDPGTHRVEAMVGETRVFESTVTIGRGGGTTKVTVTLAPDVPDARVTLAPPVPGAHFTQAPSPRASWRPLVGWSLIGTSALFAGAGAWLGVRAFDTKAESDAGCPGDRCTSAGVSHNESAKTAADLSTVGFALAVTALAAGVYFVVSSPRSRSRVSSLAAGTF